MIRCFLAGLLLGVGGIWLVWLASWINRVELTTQAQPLATALGLRFERVGWRSWVVASGAIDEVNVRVRWRTGLLGLTIAVSVAAEGWEGVPDDQAVGEWPKTRLRR